MIDMEVRPFREDDYPRHVEIGQLVFPDEVRSLKTARHHDATWDGERYFRRRLVAEDGAGQVVGWGEIHHVPWTFHPDRYRLWLEVDPAVQRRGVGSVLYERLLSEVRAHDAALVRSEAKESMAESVQFLTRRGFEEAQRSWESRLNVTLFDFATFAGADERVARQGIAITTLAAEGPRDEPVLRAVYELDAECSLDEPSLDPVTTPPFEDWWKQNVEAPNFRPEAWFLAKDGERYVGLSNMSPRLAQPGILSQGFTAVQRDYRGRGIAMALKLQTVRYARDHSYREIRTDNNARNRPMLRINEAMGFVKQPVWITYQKALRR
ncbi:MAG: GNAT family N-acetyltransferase [Chloroflexota bacterium]